MTFKPKSNNTSITKIEVKTDTILVVDVDTFNNYIPKYIHDTTKIPEYIDTNKVIDDYYSTNIYNDTITKPNYSIIIQDSINQNKIKSRNIITNIISKKITDSVFITKTTPTYPLSIYLGPTFNLNKNIGLSLNINYNRINANIGYNNGVIIGVGYRIK